ncbi:SRPBCC family protein [Pedobacter gandavensis]|uniref:Polyketide cyclase n=1 Tax=Pedobacter gandavensis TaxID=2679963 RepID=A0ABR6ESU5_9SPHI|nr:SRPBCC family protein [Pedobacter gandavensis]MBB2148338.1 polyketide cyclase [Pedobacter gandavensis]
MKILKIVLALIAGLIVLALIVALFINKDYAVEREVIINKPKQVVFDYIKLIKNQDQYSVWNRQYPNKKIDYKGTDGTVGFVYSWDDKGSAGAQEITKITDGERIDMDLRFKVPFEANDRAYMITEAVSDGQTKVKWGFNGAMKYPMNLMLLFFNMEEMLGKDLQKGLNDLKVILEKQ